MIALSPLVEAFPQLIGADGVIRCHSLVGKHEPHARAVLERKTHRRKAVPFHGAYVDEPVHERTFILTGKAVKRARRIIGLVKLHEPVRLAVNCGDNAERRHGVEHHIVQLVLE